jgi:tRNA A37 threonylcarbamoyladenosine biosynthesis protein TsaE
MSEYDFNPLDELIEKRAQGCVQELGKIWRVFLIAVSGIVLLAAERGTGKTTLVNRFLEAIQEVLISLVLSKSPRAGAS